MKFLPIFLAVNCFLIPEIAFSEEISQKDITPQATCDIHILSITAWGSRLNPDTPSKFNGEVVVYFDKNGTPYGPFMFQNSSQTNIASIAFLLNIPVCYHSILTDSAQDIWKIEQITLQKTADGL